MRIGVITFHAAENFGSALQAFALCSVLRRLGNEVKLIDYRYTNDLRQYNCFRTNIYKERPKAILGDVLYFPYNFKRKHRFEKFRDKYFEMTETEYRDFDNLDALNNQFDCFVCGSDQIWNTNCLGCVVEPYFLGFASEDKRKIAYAPSMPSDINKDFYADVIRLVNDLSFVSVRELKTSEILKDKLGVDKDISVVLDPTLLLEEKDYIKTFDLQNDKGNYIFLYILGDDPQNILMINEAKRLASKHHINIKYVYIRRIKQLKTADFCLGIGPVDFLQLIYNARFVVTDSFHATVFSLIFGKIFLTYGRKGSESRTLQLLENVNLKNHYFSSQIGDWDEDDYDKEYVTAAIKKQAKESLCFLNDALS